MGVRNSLVATLQNLGMAEQYISPVVLPYCDGGEMETLRTAVSYIFHDMQTQVRVLIVEYTLVLSLLGSSEKTPACLGLLHSDPDKMQCTA